MTFQVSARLSLDRGTFSADAQAAGRDVRGIGQAAEGAARDAAEAAANLDRMVSAARGTTAAAQAQGALAAATAQSYRETIQLIRAEQEAESARLRAQISATGRAQSLQRLAQLGRDAQAATKALTVAETEQAAASDRLAASARNLGQIQQQHASAQAAQRQTYQDAFNQRLGVSTPTVSAEGDDRGADIAAYGRSLDDLRAKYNPLFAAQRQYRNELAAIRSAERLGAISAQESAAAIERTKGAFARQVIGMRAATSAMKLTGFQATQLSYQINDIFVSLLSGQNPALVFAQQGTQVTQIFGGVRGTLAALGAVLTPTTLAFGGLTAVVAAGAVAYQGYLTSTKEVETALGGLGRSAGATADDLEALAQSTSGPAGLSVKETRSIEAALLRTGRIGAEQFGSLIGLTKDFAATIGGDLDSAADLLAQLVSKPAEGARKLAEEYRLLDGATARRIEKLVAQNRTQEAQGALIDALPDKLAKADNATTALGRAWDWVGNKASNAADAIGGAIDRAIDGPSLSERIEEIDRSLSLLQRPGRGGRSGAASRQVIIDELQRERDVLEGLLSIDRERAALIAKEQADRQKAAVARSVADNSPATEQTRRLEELRNQVLSLENGFAGTTTADEQDRLAAALDAKRRALETYIPEAEKQLQLDALDRQIAEARDPIRKAELAARREALSLAGEEITTARAQAQIERARTKAIEDSLSANRQRVAELREQAGARAAANDAIAGGMSSDLATSTMRTELELAPLLRAALAAQGDERARILALVETLREANAALNAEERRGSAIEANREAETKLDRLRTEISLVGQSETIRTRILALYDTEAEIRRRGIAGTPEAERMRALAAATADATSELERQKAAWTDIERTGESAIDRLVGVLGGDDIGEAVTGLLDDIKKQFLTFAVANPLKNALLGQNLPTLSDAGGILGRLFGGGGAAAGVTGSSVGAMTVSAGTVIVNGTALSGLSGLSGILGGAASPGAAANDAVGQRIDGAFSQFENRLASGAGGTIEAMIRQTAARYGIDPTSFATVGRIESGFNPNAVNGSMQGLFQFAPGTAAQYGLNEPFNAGLNADAAARLWRDNSRGLTSVLGRQPFGWEAYVAHQQGLGGASALFADPSRNAVSALNSLDFYRSRPGLAASAITGNGGSADMTSGAFLDLWKLKFQDMGGSLDTLANRATSVTDSLGSFGSGLGEASRSILSSSNGIGNAGVQLATSTDTLAQGTEGAFSTLLGGLGRGVDGLLSGLMSIIGNIGGSGGGGGFFGVIGSFVSGLFGGGGGAATGAPLNLLAFSGGGGTGTGADDEPAGIVHKNEYVFDAPATRAIGVPVLEALRKAAKRGYREGGLVGGGTALAPMMAGLAQAGRPAQFGAQVVAPVFQTIIQDRTNKGVEITQREEDDGRGGRRSVVIIDEMVAQQLGRPGSRSQQALRGFGVRPGTAAR
ncbi:transglycosylase-like protein with SLT domain [Breoghania corrubedonensis]|uniref:Transglycosylase-like protein with SLT domain n=1 Tax=Breoghania corrubedonensis TaxID=665038 RepID=A0A2T5VCH8_9HYPH|nr:phage tail length tape measure family protein [Breoghania corrubedonensis]PTW61435.1 transglycosylase-like protein with SLT domain [Breoghania corrubedonensis]